MYFIEQKDVTHWPGLNSVLWRQDFQWLGEEPQGICLSMYVPLRSPAGERLKPGSWAQLACRTREWLMARGQSAAQVSRLLEPLRQIDGDASFWKWPGEGLAYFSCADSFRIWRLAFPVAQRISIGGHFEASPMILSQGFASRYFVLALGRQGARLLECSHQGFRCIQSDQESCSPPAQANQLLGSFREVDRRLGELFGDHPVPLVLAASSDLLDGCRSISAYPGLIEQVIEARSEPACDQDVQKKAWFAAEPFLARVFDAALRLFKENCGSQRTSVSPQEICPAAAKGQVRFLFAAADSDPQAPIHRGSRKLLQRCALEVGSSGGKIFVVDAGAVPGGGCLAALFD